MSASTYIYIGKLLCESYVDPHPTQIIMLPKYLTFAVRTVSIEKKFPYFPYESDIHAMFTAQIARIQVAMILDEVRKTVC